MIDIKAIRHDLDVVKEKLAKRGVAPETLETIAEKDRRRREILVETEDLKHERNAASKEIGALKRQQKDAQPAIEKMRAVGDKISALDEELREVEAEVKHLLDRLPNLPHDDVPEGADEDDNVVLHQHGSVPEFSFAPKAHYELGEDLGILDFATGGRVSGSRFVYYKGLGARLERALANFMLDEHLKEGYTEMLTPYLVGDAAMYGTGQFPKFTEDVFQIEHDARDLTMIPTAEVPLTNYYRESIIPGEELPVKLTALSPCFRSEAGSAGRDTRGLIRLHQFQKVEMVKFAKPENSYDELEKMTRNAENILEKLGLAYQRIILCTGDLGFSAAKTYDIEVWLPAQDTYREISSCSNTEDFQARRAMIRYRKEDGKPALAHTLNGSGLAVGRTVAAILENYQNADGSVTIPEVLVPYMGGVTAITPENALG